MPKETALGKNVNPPPPPALQYKSTMGMEAMNKGREISEEYCTCRELEFSTSSPISPNTGQI